MSGFESFAFHHFCSECFQTLDDINNLDYKDWKSRNRDEHIAIAERWWDAQSDKDRLDIFEEHGIRWSELLRLPYWDPTKFVVIDLMHAFYLRMFQRHCRDIWGMDIHFKDGDGITFDYNKNTPSEADMQKAHLTLRMGTTFMLGVLKHAVLKQLCRESGLSFGGMRKQLFCNMCVNNRYGLALCSWLFFQRIQQGWFNDAGKRVTASTLKPTSTSEMEPIVEPLAESISTNSDAESLEVHQEEKTHSKDIISEEEATKFYLSASKTTIGKLRKAILVTICSLKLTHGNEKGNGNPEKYQNLTAPELRQKIEDSVSC
jgi:hypothetical protein